MYMYINLLCSIIIRFTPSPLPLSPFSLFSHSVFSLLSPSTIFLFTFSPSLSLSHSLSFFLISPLTKCHNIPSFFSPLFPSLFLSPPIASRTIVSIPLMVKLVETVITVYFKHYPPVKETTLQLPARMDGYGWTHLSSSLSIPETAADEFYTVCVQQFACYCLNTRLLNQLPRCSSLEEELDILTKMVQSCSSLKPK